MLAKSLLPGSTGGGDFATVGDEVGIVGHPYGSELLDVDLGTATGGLPDLEDRDIEYRRLPTSRSHRAPATLGMLCETHPMAWIRTVPDGDWVDGGGSLADLYAEVVDPVHRRVDHIMVVHSLNPRGLSAHLGLYASAMAGTATLRKVERELIALVVSLENNCHY